MNLWRCTCVASTSATPRGAKRSLNFSPPSAGPSPSPISPTPSPMSRAVPPIAICPIFRQPASFVASRPTMSLRDLSSRRISLITITTCSVHRVAASSTSRPRWSSSARSAPWLTSSRVNKAFGRHRTPSMSSDTARHAKRHNPDPRATRGTDRVSRIHPGRVRCRRFCDRPV